MRLVLKQAAWLAEPPDLSHLDLPLATRKTFSAKGIESSSGKPAAGLCGRQEVFLGLLDSFWDVAVMIGVLAV